MSDMDITGIISSVCAAGNFRATVSNGLADHVALLTSLSYNR